MVSLTPLSKWLVQQPGNTVAVRSGEEVTSRDFVLRVQGWIDALKEKQGMRWAVYHSDSFEFLVILFALWQLKRTACISSDDRPGTVTRLANSVDGFIGEFPPSVTLIGEPSSKNSAPRQWITLEPDFIALELSLIHI